MGTEEEGRKPIDVFPTWKNLKDLEDWIKRKKDYVSWPRGLVNEKDSKLNYSGPLSVPSFPAPFPTLPFSYRARRLKSFIPFQALPSKITVHDPWNLLAMGSTNMFGSSNTSAPGNADDWKTVEDKVHTYRLKILDEGMHEMYHRCETVTEQQEKCVNNLMLTLEGIWKSKNGDAGQFKVVWAKEDASDAKYYYKDARIQLITGEMLFPPSFPDTSTISAHASSPSKSDSDSVMVEPPIYLIHYPPPPSASSTQYKIPPQANMSNIRPLGENTHLYFYPEKKAGEGHHSRAYKVEWEMPRTSLFPESEDEGRDGAQKTKEPEEDYVLCKDCIREDLERQLVEVLKTDGDTSESWQVPSGLLTRVEVVEEVKEEKVEEVVKAKEAIPDTAITTGKTDDEANNVDKPTSLVDDSPNSVVVAEKEEANTKPAQDDVKDDSNVTTTKPDEDEDPATLLDDSDWETVTDQPNSPDTAPSNALPSNDDAIRSTAHSPESPVIVDLPETGISSPSSNVKKHYVYTYTGPLRPILITTKYQDRMRPTCKHLDPLAKFANPPIDDDRPEEPEEQPVAPSSEETRDESKKDEEGATHPNDDNTSSSSPHQAPTSSPPKDPLPPTTKVRALAKLAYSSMYSPSCNHRGCSGSSSNHCDHLTKEAWCYEWFGVKDGGNVGMYTHWGSKPKTKAEAEEAREGAGEGEGEGNTQNAEGEERNEEKKQEEEDEGDIELGAIVPRYYGFWVHDENCPCEAPERTEKVEEKEEEPKEEVTVEQPQEQPQEQPPAQPQEQVQEQPQEQPQQPLAQAQEGQDAHQQPGEVQPVRGEDQQQVQDAQPQQPDEVQQTQVEDQQQVEEPQQQQQQDDVQEEQHQPQEEVPPLQEQEQVVVEQRQGQEEAQVPVERQEEETPQLEVQERPQIPEEAEVEGHQEVQEAAPRPEQQTTEGEGHQPVQEQVQEEAQGPQLNQEHAQEEVQEPTQEQIPSQAVQERQQEHDQVQSESTQAPVQEDAKEEETNVVENVEAVVENRNENEGAVVIEDVIERANEEQKDEDVEAKDDSGEAQEDDKGPEVVEGADRRPDDVAGDNSQGVSDTAPAAGDGSDNTQAVVDDSNPATADANAANNAEVVEEKEDDDTVEEATDAAANEEVEQEEEQKKDKGYFSDILLMENCGWPVDRIKLRDDEKETIQNLFRRFHNYGWVHYSPWKRNVVYHWGPINRSMEKRKTDKDNRKLSFRLIDFGRARHYRGWNEGGEREETWRSKVQSEEKDIREEFPV